MGSEELLRREMKRRRAAADVLTRLGLMERWSRVGRPKLVGAAAYGLMVALDVDIEIYCDVPTVDPGFAIVSEVARQPGVWKVRFSNELGGPDQGLYWQVRYRGDGSEVWKIDTWLLSHDHPGPRSVDLDEPMRRVLTDETRAAILGIKETLLGEADVHAVEIYEAVLDHGVRTAEEFRAWQSSRTRSGLTF
jgi:hypothetical protein